MCMHWGFMIAFSLSETQEPLARMNRNMNIGKIRRKDKQVLLKFIVVQPCCTRKLQCIGRHCALSENICCCNLRQYIRGVAS